jgi:tripartite-type tricarboxylate transporter receptor subunit TctC
MLKHCVACIALALAVVPAQAQGNKPITLVVGFAPGGTSSIVAHYLAEGLQARLKTPVIVENKPGAGGLVAADFVKRQAPDGATLLILSSTTLMKVPPTMEITPISQVATYDYVFAAGSAVRAETLGDYFGAARADESLRTYASPGAGTLPHLIVEALAQQASVPMIAVQFRGSAPAALHVLGAHVPAAMLPMPDYIPHRDSIRAIAVAAEKRSRLLPAVPTMSEDKFNVKTIGWIGLFAPQHTPRDKIQRLSAAVKGAIGAKPRFLSDKGFEPTGTTPEELGRIHRRDFERWQPVLQELGITP